MSAFAQQELRNATFDERCKWIETKKEEGNAEFKLKKYGEAIDAYMAALCGFAFKKDITPEQKDKVENGLKIPVLNNMALCLMH